MEDFGWVLGLKAPHEDLTISANGGNLVSLFIELAKQYLLLVLLDSSQTRSWQQGGRALVIAQERKRRVGRVVEAAVVNLVLNRLLQQVLKSVWWQNALRRQNILDLLQQTGSLDLDEFSNWLFDLVFPYLVYVGRALLQLHLNYVRCALFVCLTTGILIFGFWISHYHAGKLKQVALVFSKGTSRHQFFLKYLDCLHLSSLVHQLNVLLLVYVVDQDLLTLLRQVSGDSIKKAAF